MPGPKPTQILVESTIRLLRTSAVPIVLEAFCSQLLTGGSCSAPSRRSPASFLSVASPPLSPRT